MRLKEGDDPAREGFECCKRCGNLVRVVAEIVDDRDVVGGADNVEAAGKAVETFYRANGLRDGHAERGRGGDGGKSVGDIVATGDDERDVMGFAHCVQRETASQRQINDIGRAEISLRCKAEADGPCQRQGFHERHSLCIIGVPHACLCFFGKVTEQLAQFFKAFMVEADIVEHRDFGGEQGDRAIAFVDLRNENVPLPDARAGKRRVIGDEIFHHRAVHDRRVEPCIGQYPADHARDGRLSAGSANGNAARRIIEQIREQLCPRHAGTTQGIRLGHIRHAVFDSSRRNQDLLTAN